MADEPNPAGDPAAPDGGPPVNERVQELTWALVDEQITDDEVRLLDNLLLSDDGARDTYVGCIQLHTDLMDHFGSLPGALEGAEAAKSPVVGLLSDPSLPFGPHLPTAEDSHS